MRYYYLRPRYKLGFYSQGKKIIASNLGINIKICDDLKIVEIKQFTDLASLKGLLRRIVNTFHKILKRMHIK